MENWENEQKMQCTTIVYTIHPEMTKTTKIDIFAMNYIVHILLKPINLSA